MTETLKYIFSDNNIVRDMSLASTKSSIPLLIALTHIIMLSLWMTSRDQSYFSLIVDKTTQQNMKQLDIYVRYWSLMENKIAARYLNSCFLGHATADIMKDNIVKCLTEDELSLAKMIMLSSDGSNVNKSLKNKLVNA